MDWKLVPETATEEMRLAAMCEGFRYRGMTLMLHSQPRADLFAAMLAASPTPPDGLYRVAGGEVERVEADDETVDRLAQAAYERRVGGRRNCYAWGDPCFYAEYPEDVDGLLAEVRAALKALGAS